MAFTVKAAADLWGTKLNYIIEFPSQPTKDECISRMREALSRECDLRRGTSATGTFDMDHIQVLDGAEQWAELSKDEQLTDGVQLFVYQVASEHHADVDGNIPVGIQITALETVTTSAPVIFQPVISQQIVRQPVQQYTPPQPVQQYVSSGVVASAGGNTYEGACREVQPKEVTVTVPRVRQEVVQGQPRTEYRSEVVSRRVPRTTYETVPHTYTEYTSEERRWSEEVPTTNTITVNEESYIEKTVPTTRTVVEQRVDRVPYETVEMIPETRQRTFQVPEERRTVHKVPEVVSETYQVMKPATRLVTRERTVERQIMVPQIVQEVEQYQETEHYEVPQTEVRQNTIYVDRENVEVIMVPKVESYVEQVPRTKTEYREETKHFTREVPDTKVITEKVVTPVTKQVPGVEQVVRTEMIQVPHQRTTTRTVPREIMETVQETIQTPYQVPGADRCVEHHTQEQVTLRFDPRTGTLINSGAIGGTAGYIPQSMGVVSQPVYSQQAVSQPVYSQQVVSQPAQYSRQIISPQPVYSQQVVSQPVAYSAPQSLPITSTGGVIVREGSEVVVSAPVTTTVAPARRASSGRVSEPARRASSGRVSERPSGGSTTEQPAATTA